MAEPVDPNKPADADPAHLDDQVGFASPAAMQGRPRAEDELLAEPEPDLFDPPASDPPADRPSPPPVEAARAFEASPPPVGRAEASRVEPGMTDSPDNMKTVTLYALILFAVPTLGVSALIGILGVMGRTPPSEALARSHFVFQQRTLWAAAVAAVIGLILIVVNLGVFVLFIAAVWTLIRGVVGVLRFKAGQAMTNPQTLFI